MSSVDHDHPRFRFSTRMRVDFADTDAFGHVYFGRYSRYLERAVIEYRRAVGIALLGEPGHLFVVRSLSIDYHAAARFDDDLEVFVRTLRIGTTSHTHDLRIERIDTDGALHLADARVVIVGVGSEGDGPPTPMPGGIRAAIEAFEA
ncbi:MAG: acyl-CoA thioesterase [Thermoleophilia bacterium]|nr:acyl-CoA thioesterase [Thermoleophilia bacterium]